MPYYRELINHFGSLQNDKVEHMGLLLIFLNSLMYMFTPAQAGYDSDLLESVNSADSLSVPVLDYTRLKPYLTKQNDTTYVVNFWATWCAPCVKELPYFEDLNRDMKNEKVKVILVSLDFKKQIESKLIPFIRDHDLKSEVIVLYDNDSNFWINDISSEWSGAIPATLVYRNKERTFYERVFHTREELNEIIQPYLNL